MSQPAPPLDPAREALEVIARLRLRELNPGEAARNLLRVAERLDQTEVREKLRTAAGHLVAAEEELRRARESLQQQ